MFIYDINPFGKNYIINMLCNAEKNSLKNFHCNLNNFIHKKNNKIIK